MPLPYSPRIASLLEDSGSKKRVQCSVPDSFHKHLSSSILPGWSAQASHTLRVPWKSLAVSCCTPSSIGDVMKGHHRASMSPIDIVTLRRVAGFQNLSVKLDLRSFGGFSITIFYLSLPSSLVGLCPSSFYLRLIFTARHTVGSQLTFGSLVLQVGSVLTQPLQAFFLPRISPKAFLLFSPSVGKWVT